jgi:hypothetical protein
MFNLLSGYETANIKSYAFKTGEVIKDGEWVVFDTATGKLKKQVGAYDPITQGLVMPVFGGNDVRFDSKFMGAVSCVTSTSFSGETDVVQAVTINPGDALTILDGKLTKATVAETTVVGTIVGYATRPNTNGVIEFIRA